MKLIFENENEENIFWAAAVYDKGVCPSQLGLHEDDSCLGPEPKRCFECWKNSGLETEMKSESDSTAEFKARLERLRKFIFMICGDNWSEIIHEGYGQCAITPEDVCFLCEIEEEEEEENHEKPLISREKILEKRCERYREIIRSHVNVEDMVAELLKEGKLSPNDARYLFELEEVDTAKGLIGYPEVFTADPDRTVKKKPPLGIMPRWIWERKRCREIAEAICRYTYAGKSIPAEWIEEYNELVEKGTDRQKEN